MTCRIAFCLLFASAAMWAQNTAQINGAIKDSAGLAVPGAEVKATQTATGAVRTAVSGADGAYVLPNLPLGPYQVEVSKEGFSKYVQSGILLQVDDNRTIDAALKVGAVNEQVTVQADASLVETHSTSVGTVVDEQRVLEMPLNGRDVTELIFLAGMATPGVGSSSLRNYPTILISVAGGIGPSTQYMVDGTNHNDSYNNLNYPLPFPDALQEFKVETSALPAQYGYHSGATVNIVTKSGTNQLHGDLFEFFRNGDLNARDSFAPARDTVRRNQFGGVIGGPIIKNKLFFFAGWQDTIQRSTPSQNVGYVPTPAMLAGDFTAFASPACNAGKQYTLKSTFGFNNNIISPSLFSPAALKFAALLPTTTNPCGQAFYPLLSDDTENLAVARADYQKSDKHSLFLRFQVANYQAPSTYVPGNELTANANAQADRFYSLAFGDTYLIGSSMVNSFHLGATRASIVKVPDNISTWPKLGVNAAYNPDTEPAAVVTGGNGFNDASGSDIINTDYSGPNPHVSDDVSWVKGTHQIGFGASFLLQILNYASGVNAVGRMTFDGSSTGLGMADFLTGNAVTWSQGNVQSYLYARQKYYGLYIQDSWKATSRLTINYGVRWEPFFGETNKHGYYDNFLPAQFYQNVHSTKYPNAPAGLFFPGDPQWSPGGTSIAATRYNEFMPRLGLVWDPFGTGKTTIRASAGMFNDRSQMYTMSSMEQDSPYGVAILVNNVKMDNPWASYGGNPLPYVLSPNTPFPTYANMVNANFHWKPPETNQFNLSIQRQVGQDWLLQANYVGNTTSHIVTEDQTNAATFLGLGPCTLNGVSYPVCSTTANTNQRRPYVTANPTQGGYYALMSYIDDGGTASYNGLFLSAQKRLSKGISVLANYTWSHCIGDLWNSDPGNVSASSVTPFGRKNSRGNCASSDVRHVFNLSAVATTPKFANRALRLLASDWQFAPILKLKSAQFYTVATGVDTALNGEGGQRANIVAGVNPYINSTNPHACAATYCVAWANPAAYISPAIGTLGTLSFNSQRGPAFVQVDMAMSRTFAVWEKKTLQLRAETFNLPNHVNLSAPAPSLTNANSFAITSDVSGTSSPGAVNTGDFRVIQFAMKFVF